MPYLYHELTCSRLSQEPNYSQASQCLRLSTSRSVSERQPPKPMVCLLQREKSLLINLLQTAWRKWPGGCKLSLVVEDEGQKRERGMDRRSVAEERKIRKERRKRGTEGNGDLWKWTEEGGEEGGAERGKSVCAAWCKPWVLLDGWIWVLKSHSCPALPRIRSTRKSGSMWFKHLASSYYF